MISRREPKSCMKRLKDRDRKTKMELPTSSLLMISSSSNTSTSARSPWSRSTKKKSVKNAKHMQRPRTTRCSRSTSWSRPFHSVTSVETICGFWRPQSSTRAKESMSSILCRMSSTWSRGIVRAFPRSRTSRTMRRWITIYKISSQKQNQEVFTRHQPSAVRVPSSLLGLMMSKQIIAKQMMSSNKMSQGLQMAKIEPQTWKERMRKFNASKAWGTWELPNTINRWRRCLKSRGMIMGPSSSTTASSSRSTSRDPYWYRIENSTSESGSSSTSKETHTSASQATSGRAATNTRSIQTILMINLSI